MVNAVGIEATTYGLRAAPMAFPRVAPTCPKFLERACVSNSLRACPLIQHYAPDISILNQSPGGSPAANDGGIITPSPTAPESVHTRLFRF